MNAVESFACTGVFPTACTHSVAVFTVASSVRIVRTILTDDGAVKTATEWVQAVGKTPVQTKDSTAFIVNRLLVPYLLDAIRVYESGLSSLEDIDAAMKLGCGYPMGPFSLLDLVGLDTTMYVAESMFEEFREARYAPPPLLKRMVMAGWMGKKSGKGFYDWSVNPAVPSELGL